MGVSTDLEAQQLQYLLGAALFGKFVGQSLLMSRFVLAPLNTPCHGGILTFTVCKANDMNSQLSRIWCEKVVMKPSPHLAG